MMAEMRVILAKLELVSNGSVQAWNASGGHSGEPDDKVVEQIDRGTENPPHIVFREWYEGEHTEEGRRSVIRAARKEYERITGRYEIRRERPKIEKTDLQILAERIVKEGEGWTAREVADTLHTTITTVRSARLAAERDIDFGREVDVVDPDMRVRIEQRIAAGFTERQIATIEKISKSTVRRVIGKAA